MGKVYSIIKPSVCKKCSKNQTDTTYIEDGKDAFKIVYIKIRMFNKYTNIGWICKKCGNHKIMYPFGNISKEMIYNIGVDKNDKNDKNRKYKRMLKRLGKKRDKYPYKQQMSKQVDDFIGNIKCSYCGTEREDGNFCPYCGKGWKDEDIPEIINESDSITPFNVDITNISIATPTVDGIMINLNELINTQIAEKEYKDIIEGEFISW